MTTTEESDRVVLGEKLRECREYLGFSQEEVAGVMKISRSAISLIEAGQRKVDALELKRLARLYQRPVAYFTGEDIFPASNSHGIQVLARKASQLSESDLNELQRFAEFLGSRTQTQRE